MNTNFISILADSLSDKESFHRYGLVYALLIENLYLRKKRPLRVLEIGIYQGGSMDAFLRCPYIDMYVGIDLHNSDLCVDVPENAHLFLQDAYTAETVEMLKKDFAPFDMLIDDADHTEYSMNYFFPNYRDLCEDGWLVLEDVTLWWASIAEWREAGVRFADFQSNRPWDVEEHQIQGILPSVLGLMRCE